MTPSLSAPRPAGLAIVGSVGLLLAAAGVAAGPTPDRGQVALLSALAFLPYAGLLVVTPPRDRDHPAGPLLAALGVGLALVWGPPLLSDDVYRFLWDGRVLRAGIDPYRFAPDDPALSFLRDGYWARINHPDIPTIYPPLAQAVFAAGGGIAHHPRTFQLLGLGLHLGTVVLVHRGLPPGPSRSRATWLLALCPLALVESAGSGHLDGAVGLALLGLVVALRRGRLLRAAGATVSAAAWKVVGLLAVPLIWRRSRLAGALTLVLGSLVLAPIVGAGTGSGRAGGIHHYAARWRGNDGPYAFVEGLVAAATGPVLGPAGAFGSDRLPGRLAPLAGSAVDPLKPFRSPKKGRVAVPPNLLVGLVARALVVLAALATVIRIRRRRDDVPEGARDALALRGGLLVGLLFAPQIHPWYLLWLLPLEIVLGRRTGLVWAAVVFGSYAGAEAWARDRLGVNLTAFRAVEYALVLATLSLEELRPYLPGGWPAARRARSLAES